MKKLFFLTLTAVTAFFQTPCALAGSEQKIDKNANLKNLLKTFKPSASISSDQAIELISNSLMAEFDRFLQQPELYKKRVLKECSIFPEGDIYPFLLPSMAYANIAVKKPELKAHCIKQMRILLDFAIPFVTTKVRPPGGKLQKLTNYQKHATYLGTLNLALSCYEFVARDGKYKKLNDKISDVLRKAIEKKQGESIRSYPEYSWNFDTMIALASLSIYDCFNSSDNAKKLTDKHLKWLAKHASCQATGLPYSIGWDNAKEGKALPRGCDLSMRISLLSQINRKAAKELYDKYVKAHWIDHGFIAGFSEWPKGTQQNHGDVDSGPVIMEVGLTATGIGLAAAMSADDKKRLDKLCSELMLVKPAAMFFSLGQNKKKLPFPFNEWSKMFAEINPNYFTGFLYGDASLFYAITWTRYPNLTAKKERQSGGNEN